MKRLIGTVSRGIRLPVVVEGDDIVSVVAESVIAASKSSWEPFEIRDRDVVGVTESLVARAQGNYVSSEDIAADVRAKFPDSDIAVLFPIMSRNRFFPLLRGIAAGCSGRVRVVLSYPTDEVGNQLIAPDVFYDKMGELPPRSFDKAAFRDRFGTFTHPFTGVDYIELYESAAPGRVEVLFSNDPKFAAEAANNVLVASIHMRELHKKLLRSCGARVAGLDEICSRPVRDGAGYNPDYGLLGSNYTSDERIKLFPRDADKFAEALAARLRSDTGRAIETLVYGDGAFKDPACGIWELADPVVSPGFTSGLVGTPKEIKFKYIVDSTSEADKRSAVEAAIRAKGASSADAKAALGTTPRNLTDLIGSLCDLTSGSGDKGTPVVYISGYFSSYIDD